MPGRIERTPEMARKTLATLWERNLPVVRDRVEELQRAVGDARAGAITVETRESAHATAHKLAGSLGMFGYPLGTAAARQAELQLEGVAPIDAASLAASVAALRDALPL